MTKGRNFDRQDDGSAMQSQIARRRFLTKCVSLIEDLLPRVTLPLSILALFCAVAWFGLFRMMPDWLRLVITFGFLFAFCRSFLKFSGLTWLSDREALRRLEQRNNLAHQPILTQDDQLASQDSPIAKALWLEHQKRMAKRLSELKIGSAEIDLTSRDPYGLRAIPALAFVVAIAFLPSNHSGRISDAFRFNFLSVGAVDDLRIDAWITPPDYTARAPVFLKAEASSIVPSLEVPEGSILTVRIAGGDETDVTYATTGSSEPSPLAAKPASDDRAAAVFEQSLQTSGTLTVGSAQWDVTVIPDTVPSIAFQEKPKATVNGALEIKFTAKDDWGVRSAFVDIQPLGAKPDSVALFDLPEFALSFSRQNTRDIKATSSKDLSEHPLAGKRVAVRLIAEDGAGQKGMSPALEMILPAKPFRDPLAASIAEQRQIFSLNVMELPKALAYNEAIGLRADETIPNLGHYLLLQSARHRMQLTQNVEGLVETADYLWNVALEIEDAGLSDAQRRLKEAQENLAEALERGASSEEIAKLTQELREAMNALMQELAKQGQQNQQAQQNQNQRTLNQRDLENMMNQIENLAKSGNREAAQQLMNELQRMLNNLQMAQPRSGQQQEGQQSQADEQIQKLGEILQQQQKLLDETFRLDQQLRDQESAERMQRDFPEEGQEQAPSDGGPTAEELREALKKLREQQDGIAKQMQEMQEALKGMGVEPQEGFGKAEREMRGAGEALGKGNGERATERQAEALNALRQGAQSMMQQMMQNMQGQQGEGSTPGQGQRDPLGRDNGNSLSQEYNIPDEMDVQRAREILNAIGEKLGKGLLNEVERQYLERLLGTQ
jgi:uncharacterized protein (TIGR02302 family)